MTVPSPPLKTILELVLWNGLQSCHCIFWWHGCAVTQSGTEPVQDIYTVFELAYIMYKIKLGLTQ
jgi:hypothetical protein